MSWLISRPQLRMESLHRKPAHKKEDFTALGARAHAEDVVKLRFKQSNEQFGAVPSRESKGCINSLDGGQAATESGY